MRYVLCVPVWGEFFRDVWARWVVPSYLAPGNLPVLAEANEIDVLIFTRNEDADWLAQQRWIRALSEIASISIVPLPAEVHTPDMHLKRGEPMQLKYTVHSRCIRHAEQRYRGQPDVVLLPAYGDGMWTAGYCRTIAEALADGRHVVTAPALSVDLGGFGPALDARIAERATGAFDSGEICRLAFHHPHPGHAAQIWTSGVSSANFSYFYWPVGDEGLVSHLVHPGANAVHLGRIRPEAFTFSGSIDMRFVFMASPDVTNVAVIRDSMDGFVLEIANRAYQRAEIRDRPWTPEGLGAELGHFLSWGMLFDPKTQGGVALTPCRFRYGPCSDAWERVEAESTAAIRATLENIALPADAAR